MRCLAMVLAIVCLAVGGCGGGGDGVSGTVTLDGQPLSGATITFAPKGGGRPGMGTTDSSGKFKLEYLLDNPQLPEGEYIVRITTATTEKDADGNEVEVPESLPPQYNTESTLTRTVTGGDDFKFELKSQ